MTSYSHYLLSLISLYIVVSCGSYHQFSMVIKEKNKLTSNQNLTITIHNKKSEKIDSIIYLFQGEKHVSNDLNITIPLKQYKLGKHKVSIAIHHDNAIDTLHKNVSIFSSTKPDIYTYKIINTYPHDINSYTQGLEFHNDTLYESTGLYGKSKLKKIDYKTGKTLQSIDLNQGYFGEGITLLNDHIYQLSWRSKTGFIYDMNLNKNQNFAYNQSKEGWGLCNDGAQIYKSDGTEKIWILDPTHLTEKSYIQTCSDKTIFSKSNELEWVNGDIYANTYLKDGIMIINPITGAIKGVVDCRGLKEKVTQHQTLDVLNGIAYHKGKGTFFLTGKNWDKMFEVKIIKK